jgi:hypothetical protein
LFEQEKEAREWECVTANRKYGEEVVVHAGAERMAAGQGVVLTLGHQAYPGVTPLVSDDDVFEAVRYLVRPTQGRSTLFMYGMTGSGKTHTMAGIHQRAPVELMQGLRAGQTLTLSAYELVGKRCYDLLSPSTASVGQKRQEGAEEEGGGPGRHTAHKVEVFLRVGEDGDTHVCGCTVCGVSSAEELQTLLQRAAARRETARTVRFPRVSISITVTANAMHTLPGMRTPGYKRDELAVSRRLPRHRVAVGQ